MQWIEPVPSNSMFLFLMQIRIHSILATLNESQNTTVKTTSTQSCSDHEKMSQKNEADTKKRAREDFETMSHEQQSESSEPFFSNVVVEDATGDEIQTVMIPRKKPRLDSQATMTNTTGGPVFTSYTDSKNTISNATTTVSADEDPNLEVYCHCGDLCRRILTKSQTSKFYGKYFYACPNKDLRSGIEGCKFWKLEVAILQERKKAQQGVASASMQNGKIYSASQVANTTVGDFDKRYPFKSQAIVYREQMHRLPDDQVCLDSKIQQAFCKLAEHFGYKIHVCSKSERQFQHVDLQIYKGKYKENAFYVKIVPAEWMLMDENKKDQVDKVKDFDHIYLPVHDMFEKNTGYVLNGYVDDPSTSGGRADVIVFENAQGFYLLDRKGLVRYLTDRIMTAPLVSRREEAINKRWQCPNTLWIESRVPMNDLKLFTFKDGDKDKRVVIAFWSLQQLSSKTTTSSHDSVDKPLLTEAAATVSTATTTTTTHNNHHNTIATTMTDQTVKNESKDESSNVIMHIPLDLDE